MANGVQADQWPSIEPGALKHQITFNQQSSTQDSFGQPVPTWTQIRTCWGGINLVGMREAFGNNQLTSQSTDIWTVRWTSTVIQPGMQIVFGSSTYRVQAVSNPGKRNIYLHILCLELNATSAS
jgi:SPP1 family predicted phage head-tail adaptor